MRDNRASPGVTTWHTFKGKEHGSHDADDGPGHHLHHRHHHHQHHHIHHHHHRRPHYHQQRSSSRSRSSATSPWQHQNRTSSEPLSSLMLCGLGLPGIPAVGANGSTTHRGPLTEHSFWHLSRGLPAKDVSKPIPKSHTGKWQKKPLSKLDPKALKP